MGETITREQQQMKWRTVSGINSLLRPSSQCSTLTLRSTRRRHSQIPSLAFIQVSNLDTSHIVTLHNQKFPSKTGASLRTRSLIRTRKDSPRSWRESKIKYCSKLSEPAMTRSRNDLQTRYAHHLIRKVLLRLWRTQIMSPLPNIDHLKGLGSYSHISGGFISWKQLKKFNPP